MTDIGNPISPARYGNPTDRNKPSENLDQTGHTQFHSKKLTGHSHP